jgi:chromosome segregation ATPase
MKKLLLISCAAAILASCSQNSSEQKRLQAENDSLKIENAKATSEMNEMLSIINDVETSIQSIKDAENFLTVQKSGDLAKSDKEQIKENMQLISETLVKNRKQISELEEKLRKSGINSASLKKTIARLNAELDQKANMIVTLQEDLAKKNVKIEELDNMVSSLNENVENLSSTAASQAKTIKEQDTALNTAYYCFGTAKELKDQKILTGGGLFAKAKALQGDFNKDYFVSVDIRELKEIPLYAKKAKLRTNQPEASYEFVKDEDGNLTLKITNSKEFWSLGRFLVIEVN